MESLQFVLSEPKNVAKNIILLSMIVQACLRVPIFSPEKVQMKVFPNLSKVIPQERRKFEVYGTD